MKACGLICIFLLRCVIVQGQQKTIDSLQKVLKASKEDTSKVNILNALCRKMNKPGTYDSASVYSIHAQTLAEKIGFKKGIADAQMNIALINLNQKHFSNAQESALKALSLYREINNKSSEASALKLIGTIYLKQSGYPIAKQYWLQALALTQSLGDKIGSAKLLSDIGGICYYQSDYPSALEYTLKALSIYQELGKDNDIQNCLTNLGELYYSKGDYEKAREYMLRGLEISRKTGSKNACAHNLCNLGILYEHDGKYPDALDNYSKALALFKELGDKGNISMCLVNIGSAYYKQGNVTAALLNDHKALGIAQEIGDKRAIVSCYHNLADIDISNKNYTRAKIYLDSALIISMSFGGKEQIESAYKALVRLDSSMGNYKMALEYNRKYFFYRDSILNESNSKKAVEVEMNYEFAQKQAAEKAEQDKKDLIRNAETKAQKILTGLFASVAVVLVLLVLLILQLLKGAKKEKLYVENQRSSFELQALRTQMSPHFLFNVLNSIYSLAKINSDKTPDMVHRLAEMLRYITYVSGKPLTTIADEIEIMENYIELQQIRFENRVDLKKEISIDNEDALIVPMLLLPLIENAYKHGVGMRGDNSFIYINITLKQEVFKIEVQNSIAPESVKKEGYEGLGLENTRKQMDFLYKEYELTTSDMNGVFLLQLVININSYAGNKLFDSRG